MTAHASGAPAYKMKIFLAEVLREMRFKAKEKDELCRRLVRRMKYVSKTRESRKIEATSKIIEIKFGPAVLGPGSIDRSNIEAYFMMGLACTGEIDSDKAQRAATLISLPL